MHYPWQSQQWQQLHQANSQQRLPHALLFTGIAGTGKTHFAHVFSQALLCEQTNPDQSACLQCHACRLVEGGAHPDVRWITPEKRRPCHQGRSNS
jgi:DNA polymerase-3 subunit delta'